MHVNLAQHAFILLATIGAVSSIASAQLAPAYNVTGLGRLPGDVSSLAFGINDAGVIVGSSTPMPADQPPSPGSSGRVGR